MGEACGVWWVSELIFSSTVLSTVGSAVLLSKNILFNPLFT